MDRPKYSHDQIQNIQSLCRALGVPEPKLRSVTERAATLYIGPTPKPKKSGGFRDVFDTKAPLKPLLQRINSIFFRRVYYPPYLTGSLPCRDFVVHVGIHSGARRADTEDIAQFFDCITADHVHRIWREFFGFAEEVADILTRLTTKDGRVFQGTPTSSYLANLVFWDREPALAERMESRGIRYSRYVDDITMSSAGKMSEEDKQWCIAQAYGMIGGAGFKPKRAKHGAFTSRNPITIMGLNANASRQPTLPKCERSNIRTQIFQLEQRFKGGDTGSDFLKCLNKASGKIGRLKRLHEREAMALRVRVNTIREALKTPPVSTP